MVATSETSTNTLRRAQTASEIPVLDKGNPPTNGVLWKDSLYTFLYQMASIHLLQPDWSQQATTDEALEVDDDPLRMLAAKKAKDAAQLVKAEGNAKSSSSSSAEDETKVPDLGADTASPVVLHGWTECFFICPITEKVENVDARLLRRICFDRVLASIRANHAYLLAGVNRGDLARLVEAVTQIVDGQDAARVYAVVSALVKIKKVGMSAADFVAKVSGWRLVLAESSFAFDERLVREAVLQSLASDQLYAIEVAFARKQLTMSTDQILSSVLDKSRSVEAGAGKKGLAGFVAAKSDRHTPNPCFNFRDNGECKYGEQCRFSHAEAGASRKAAKAGGARASRKGCFECGGPHSIADCKIFEDRKENEATLKAELAEARAMAAAVAPPAASMAALSLPGPNATTLSSIWGDSC